MTPASGRTRRSFCLSLFSSAVLAACGSTEEEGAEPAKPVAHAARDAVASGLVGVAVGHVNVSESRSSLAVAGLRRKGQPTLVSQLDLFNIGSNTKAMTAMVIAGLVDDGKLAWTTRPADLLPGLAAAQHPAYAAITLEQLLAHRGAVLPFTAPEEGLPFLATLDDQALADPGPLPQRRARFVRWLLQQTPPDGVRPGVDFLYSNAGYALAAALAEQATGQPFESLFAQRMNKLAGVQGVWRMPSDVPVALPPAQPAGHEGPRPAVQVLLPDDELLPFEPWQQVLQPAGGWASAAAPYAHWLRWHLQALRGTSTPLPPSYVRRLRELQHGQYDMGWFALNHLGQVVLAHNGADAGFMAEVVLDRAGRHAAFAACNVQQIDADGSSWVLDLLNREVAAVLG